MQPFDFLRQWNRERKAVRKWAREDAELRAAEAMPAPRLGKYGSDHGLWDAFSAAALVAHAGGGHGGRIYLNSREAIEGSLDAGFRAIEVDVAMTADAVPVLSHDFSPNKQHEEWTHVPTASEFMARPICGCETPLSLDDLIALQADAGEVVYMIDGKGRAAGELKLANFMKRRYSADVLSRLVFQVHDLRTLHAVCELDAFGAVHYCASLRMIVRSAHLLRRYGVHTVSVDVRELCDEESLARLKSDGLMPFFYTVNDVVQLRGVQTAGGKGAFTDWLRPMPGERECE